MRSTFDSTKAFPFCYPWFQWPAVALAFPLMWVLSAFLKGYEMRGSEDA